MREPANSGRTAESRDGHLGAHCRPAHAEEEEAAVTTWRAFLDNNCKDLVSIDFLVVPTATFRVLFVLIVLANQRRRVVHFNVTEHPTALWTAEQIIQAFPDGTEPRYLLRDRDGIYGEDFRERMKAMGIKEVITAPRSPWQNPYAERLLGSVRCGCLNHVTHRKFKLPF